MSVHSSAPDANLVCLHSACVSPDYQRRGIASALLREYIARLTRAETGDARRGYKDVALLAHDRLRPLYEKAGFKVMGQSDVQWGSEPWLEMRCPIQPSSSSTAGSKSALSSQAEPFMPSQAAILAALQAQSAQSSSGARNPGQAYEQVASAANTEEELEKRLVNPADGTNKADLFCPRQQCRCMLLRKGAATWVKRAPGPVSDNARSAPFSPPFHSSFYPDNLSPLPLSRADCRPPTLSSQLAPTT